MGEPLIVVDLGPAMKTARALARANRRLEDPDWARGRCFEMSSRLQLALGIDYLVEAHWDNAFSFGNHFAVETEAGVLDMTLRQFMPWVDVPWFGAIEQWLSYLMEHAAGGGFVSLRHAL